MSRHNESDEDPSPWAVRPLGSPPAVQDETPVVDPALEFPAPAPASLQWQRHTQSVGRTTTSITPGDPFVWLSVHGGAGATSLALATAQGIDLTGAWPDPDLGWSERVVLVCRSNAAGIDRASKFLAEVAAGRVPDLNVVALVVNADAPGRPPKAVRARIHELSGVVPRVLRLDWVSQWRETPYVPNRAASKVAATINTLEKK